MTGSVTLNHQYDAAGNTTLTYLTINNGTTSVYDMFTKYSYNDQNMVTMMQRFDLSDGLAAGLIPSSQFSSSSGSDTVTPLAVTYSYDPNGNMTQMNRYSDLAATQLVASSAYSYNALNTLTGIVTTIPGQATQTYTYAYDAGGRLTQQITPDGTSNFTYDHDNQLLTDSTGSGSYTYDSNGNRTSTSSGGTSTASTVGADNQITIAGSIRYLYDQQGNLIVQATSGQLNAYNWDNRNRLSSVSVQTGENNAFVMYQYNSQNQIISRYTSATIFSGTTSTTTQTNQVYVWDGNNLLAVLNVDPTTGVPTVAQRFLSGPNENQIIAQENASSTGQAGAVSWAITDNTGSVVDVVANGSGNAILDHIVYDSFGNTVSQTNASNAMLMGYQGYILDSITGLYYANARYYSPQLGRFISQDPSGFSAGDANLYRFVGNHPTYSVDPTGLYEGGSAFTQGTGNSGFGSTSVGSSAINLTPDQWNAASQIVNNATGSGSYGGVPILQSDPAYSALNNYTVSNSALVNANTSYALSSEQANLDNAISQQATNEMVQTTNPLEGLAINAESQMATDNIDAAYANAQNQLDNADPSIAQMQDANQMQPTTIQSHWGDSAETVQGPIDRLASLPIVGTAINLGVQVGLPAGQRNYGQIALDAGSLGLLGLSAPVDTIGEALASGVSSASGTLTDATAAAQQYAGAFWGGLSAPTAGAYTNTFGGGEFSERLKNALGSLSSAVTTEADISGPQSAYQIRISPPMPGRPNPQWSIDTRSFTEGEPTANGGIRNNVQFWQQWMVSQPNTISASNAYRIQQLGLSPQIDATWLQSFPEHSDYSGETLIHHHIDQGPYAIPVPASTHVGFGPPWH